MTFRSVWYDTITGWTYAVDKDNVYTKSPGGSDLQRVPTHDVPPQVILKLIQRVGKLQEMLDDEHQVDTRDRVSEVI